MTRIAAVLFFVIGLWSSPAYADKLIVLTDDLIMTTTSAIQLPPVNVKAFSQVSILGLVNLEGPDILVEVYFMDSEATASTLTPKAKGGDCRLSALGIVQCGTGGANIGTTFKVLGPYLAVVVRGQADMRIVDLKAWLIQ